MLLQLGPRRLENREHVAIQVQGDRISLPSLKYFTLKYFTSSFDLLGFASYEYKRPLRRQLLLDPRWQFMIAVCHVASKSTIVILVCSM